MTLTEFLLARIAEDEAAAEQSRDGNLDWFDSDHQMRWTPTRVLAECEAKRRIVETHRHADYSFGNSRAECPSMPRPLAESMILRDFAACDTLLLLATVYADHPDYREEWRP